MSKVIRIYFGFALLRLVIGLEHSRHFLSQSEVKPEPIVTCSCIFSRASCLRHVFASNSDWFTGISVSFVIGQCVNEYNYFEKQALDWKHPSQNFALMNEYNYFEKQALDWKHPSQNFALMNLLMSKLKSCLNLTINCKRHNSVKAF